MLEKIREGSHGTVAKVVLGLVILSFALAGVGSYLGSPVNLIAAVVNGEEIERSTFENSFQSERARMERQFGDYFSQMIEDPAYLRQFRSGVLQRLVDEVLVNQAVEALDVRASDAQIKNEIRSTPQFQVDGQFSNELYLNFIRRSGFSPSQFRELVRGDLNRRQLLSALAGSEFVVPQELKLRHRLEGQIRDVNYIDISASAFKAGVKPTDEEMQAFYDENLAMFNEPEKVALEYVELKASDLGAQQDVTDVEVEEYYNQHLGEYQTAEQRKVAHILFSGDDAAQQAQAALEKIQGGADFAELAKELSQDTFSAENGGELDWFERGVMDPAFDEAAFALAADGELSQPVESAFGYHLIKRVGVREAKTKPLEEVKPQVKESLAKQRGLDLFFDQQQALTDLAFEVPDTLSDAAEEIGTEVKTTALFSRDDAPQPFNHQAVLRAAFSEQVLEDGMNSDIIEIAPEHVMVIRVAEHQAARTTPFDQVKIQVDDQIRSRKAMEKAAELAEQIKQKLQANEGVEELLSENKLDLVEKADVTRTDAELAPAILQMAFSLPRPSEGQSSVDAGEAGTNRYAIVQVTSVKDPAAAEEGELTSLSQRFAPLAEQQGYQQLLAGLRAQADIVYTENAN